MAIDLDTVVMSGGAPQSPLIAGFLYALLKEKKTFTSFHTSGAGALMALLLLAPRNGNPCKALEDWVESGVDDQIYAGLPVNFKLFRKPGPFSSVFHLMAERFKVPRDDGHGPDKDPVKEVLAELLATPLRERSGSMDSLLSRRKDQAERLQNMLIAMWRGEVDDTLRADLVRRKDPIKRLRDTWLTSWLRTDDDRRLYNDLVELWFSALTPSTLTYRSKGLAAPLPFLEEIVDFTRLAKLKNKVHLCVNAYNMTEDAKLTKEDRKIRKARNEKVMKLFEHPMNPNNKDQKEPLGAQHIRAAFSMPFIYPPARIGDDYYSEGADHQPINFHSLEKEPNRTVVLLDVLAKLEDLLVRTPRDLWDAYVISIMTPVVALAHEDIDDFRKGVADRKLIHVEWEVPPEFQPYLMDWSYSNLDKLFEAGEEAGRVFLNGDKNKGLPAHKDRLPDYATVFGEDPPPCHRRTRQPVPSAASAAT
jgi:hypothetical protein